MESHRIPTPSRRTHTPPSARAKPNPIDQLGLNSEHLSTESRNALEALFGKGCACVTRRDDGGYHLQLATDMVMSSRHLCDAAQALAHAGHPQAAAKLLAHGILCRRASQFADESPGIDMLAALLRQHDVSIDETLLCEVTVYVHMLDSCGDLPSHLASHFSLERVIASPDGAMPTGKAFDKVLSTAARLCASKHRSARRNGRRILTAVITGALTPDPGELARQRAVDELGKAAHVDKKTGRWNAAGLAYSTLMDQSGGTSDLVRCEQALEAVGCKVCIDYSSGSTATCTVTGFDAGPHGDLMLGYVVARLLDPSMCPMPIVDAYLEFLCEQAPQQDLLTALWNARCQSSKAQSPEPSDFKRYCIELLLHIAARHRGEPALNRSIDGTFHVLLALHGETSDASVFNEIVNLTRATPTDLSLDKILAIPQLKDSLNEIWQARFTDEKSTLEERALNALAMLLFSNNSFTVPGDGEKPIGTQEAWKAAIPLTLLRWDEENVVDIQAWLTQKTLINDCPLILQALIGFDKADLGDFEAVFEAPLPLGAACISHMLTKHTLDENSFKEATTWALKCTDHYAIDASNQRLFLSLLKAGLPSKPWAYSILASNLEKAWKLA